MNEDIELLNALYGQSAKASKTLGVLLPSVENKSLRRDLLCQISDYDTLNKAIGEEISSRGLKPKKMPLKDRISIIGINMNVDADSTCENIAKVVYSASNNGARDITHTMNYCINSSPRIYSLARKYVSNEEASAERMKPYL